MDASPCSILTASALSAADSGHPRTRNRYQGKMDRDDKIIVIQLSDKITKKVLALAAMRVKIHT